MRVDLQDFAEEAKVLVQESEAGAEVHHAAEHERMIWVVARLIPRRPPPLQ